MLRPQRHVQSRPDDAASNDITSMPLDRHDEFMAAMPDSSRAPSPSVTLHLSPRSPGADPLDPPSSVRVDSRNAASLDVVMLTYQMPWPLNIVITDQSLEHCAGEPPDLNFIKLTHKLERNTSSDALNLDIGVDLIQVNRFPGDRTNTSANMFSAFNFVNESAMIWGSD